VHAEVFVILGAFHEAVKQEVDNTIPVLQNKDWKRGMGTAMRAAGLHAAENEVDYLLLTAVDLPMVKSKHYGSLLRLAHNGNRKITCAGYSNTYGIPAVFHKSVFQELQQIDDKSGAKSVISKHIDDTEIMPLPEAEFDIDYPNDVEKHWS
jgi:molybdenum cofactor cytidylyltransferase